MRKSKNTCEFSDISGIKSLAAIVVEKAECEEGIRAS